MKFTIESLDDGSAVGHGAADDWTGWRTYDKHTGEKIDRVHGFDTEAGTVDRYVMPTPEADSWVSVTEKRSFRVVDSRRDGALVAETSE
jgi:hypothetical protein